MVENRQISFSKMHGAGNDFVVLDLRNDEAPSKERCRAMSDRHTGIGCDQILGIEPPRSPDAVASYRIWTADGSPSQQCGNGARCVAAWLLRAGAAQGSRFSLDSPSRTHVVEAVSGVGFRVAMGVPQFKPEAVPLVGFTIEDDCYETYLDGASRHCFAALSIGNPHAVVEVEDIDSAPVADVGPALQHSRHLPPSVNVGFAKVVSQDRVQLRVYEYGAGETLACGSGACAAVAALIRRGRIARDVSVIMKGGELRIAWPNNSDEMSMTGPAAFVFDGVFFV